MKILGADQLSAVLASNMFGDAVEDEFITLKGLQSILMDGVLRAVYPLASIAKGCDVVYPCRCRKKDYRNDNDRYGQEPQSPRDSPGGWRVTHKCSPDACRRRTPVARLNPKFVVGYPHVLGQNRSVWITFHGFIQYFAMPTDHPVGLKLRGQSRAPLPARPVIAEKPANVGIP